MIKKTSASFVITGQCSPADVESLKNHKSIKSMHTDHIQAVTAEVVLNVDYINQSITVTPTTSRHSDQHFGFVNGSANHNVRTFMMWLAVTNAISEATKYGAKLLIEHEAESQEA